MTLEAIASLSSAVIALCALGLTIWQACIARRHNMLSVRPHLTTWTHVDEANNSYEVQLLNNGIGPAIIRTFRIQVDGQQVIGDGSEPIEKALKILFPQYQYTSYQAFVAYGYAMAPKEVRPLVTIRFFGVRLPQSEEVNHTIKRARLVIEYSSIYDQPFVLDSDTLRANPTVHTDLARKAARGL